MDTKGIVENIKAGVSGIHIQGQDFARMDEEIEAIATELKFKVKEWNQGYGWVDFKNKRVLKLEQDVSLYEDLKAFADDNPKGRLYVIKNAYSVLNSDFRAVARLQHELLRIKRHFCGNSAILLVAKERIDFSEISGLIATFHCPPLASNQVEEIFHSFLQQHSISVSTDVKNKLIATCSGMEREMVFRVLQTLKNSYETSFDENAINDALTLKKGLLSQSGLLELIDTEISIDQIGGLDKLKNWLRNKKYIIDDLPRAQRIGISAPKGVLLTGIPGCGKSMSAKAAASLFNVPLLRLDIGSLMGKFVGESEANMKAALKIAEKASPCVLWIDELEKAFSGVNGSGGSTEITTRLFGYFLTWMQEKQGAVFVVATANDITTIPPELLRRGRFDEIFSIDLPSQRERKQIFKVKTESLPSVSLDFKELAEKTEDFSGADIECVINDTLEDQFRSKQATLTQEALKNNIKLITPIGAVLKNKIDCYHELFEQFSLKSASLSEEEFKKLESSSASRDRSERENAASNEFLSPKRILDLTKDDNPDVRRAALNNPSCPIEALKQIIEGYEPFDFRKSGLWSPSGVTKEEFNLALQHPNMSGTLIVDLYEKKKINSDKLLSLAHKLKQEKSAVFKVESVTLPGSIKSGTVRDILVSLGSIVKPKDVIFEIDNEQNSTKRITASVSGQVKTICVQIGKTLSSGDVLAEINVPRKVLINST